MRTVIAGASGLGKAAAEKLISADHEVVVIDIDRARLDELSGRLDCGLVHGDCTLPSTLREAAGDEVCALLALTDSDQDNILCAKVALSVGYERVVPQIVKTELLAICEELSIPDVVTPHETVSAGLVDLLEKCGRSDHDPHLVGDLRLMRHEAGRAHDGKALSDLPLERRAKVIALQRGEQANIAEDDTVLRDGDLLVILVRRGDAERIHDALTKEADG